MIVATAGHVDHGKSTLVRLLTGTEPDRWAEEQRRGLTIDLGFAWLALPDGGGTVGFVDVPGHERFVRNMLAGCGAIDLALLAVSAREGWKPQTEEHVQILDRLGVAGGVVALTFADTVDGAALAAAADAVRARLAGTFLAGATVIPTAADRPDTIAELRASLAVAARSRGEPADRHRPRLWVDRSFVRDGAGRIVTGTLAGGSLTAGQVVTVMGDRAVTARLRALRVWGRERPDAPPGTRVALNLSGLPRSTPPPARGDAVVIDGQWQRGTRLHVTVQPVRGLDRPLRPGGGYTVHLGTTHVPAQVRHLPGTTVTRLHLTRSLGPVAPGDRVVIRDDSTRATVAGAVVLAVDDGGTQAGALAARAALLGAHGLDRPADLAALLRAEHDGAAPADLVTAATGRADHPGTAVVNGCAVDAAAAEDRRTSLRRDLAAGRTVALDGDPVGLAVATELARARQARLEGTTVGPRADGDALDAARARAETAIEAHDPALLTPAEVGAAAGIDAGTVAQLVGQRRLVPVGAHVTTHTRFDAWAVAVEGVLRRGPATAGELRAALGLPRRLAVPLLEALDAAHRTVRDGDRRRLPATTAYQQLAEPG